MFKGWRTHIATTFLLFIPGLLEAATEIILLPEWIPIIPKDYLPYWMLFVAVVNYRLREITDTPPRGRTVQGQGEAGATTGH